MPPGAPCDFEPGPFSPSPSGEGLAIVGGPFSRRLLYRNFAPVGGSAVGMLGGADSCSIDSRVGGGRGRTSGLEPRLDPARTANAERSRSEHAVAVAGVPGVLAAADQLVRLVTRCVDVSGVHGARAAEWNPGSISTQSASALQSECAATPASHLLLARSWDRQETPHRPRARRTGRALPCALRRARRLFLTRNQLQKPGAPQRGRMPRRQVAGRKVLRVGRRAILIERRTWIRCSTAHQALGRPPLARRQHRGVPAVPQTVPDAVARAPRAARSVCACSRIPARATGAHHRGR